MKEMTHTRAFPRWGTGRQTVSELEQGELMERCHEMEFGCCHERKEKWVSQTVREDKS